MERTLHYILYFLLLPRGKSVQATSHESNSSNSCAVLKFENNLLPNGILYVEKSRRTIDIIFSLLIVNCSSLTDFDIEISRFSFYDRVYTPHCFIIQRENACYNRTYHMNTLCSCLPNNGQYRFQKTNVTSADTPLRWSVKDKLAEDVVISLIFTESPRMPRLTINGMSDLQVIPRNKSVTILCSWEHEILFPAARLFYTHGRELINNVLTTGNITHVISNVQCQDSGEIGCEVNGLDKILRNTLLVKCPPDLDNKTFFQSAITGHDYEFTIPLHAHSTLITNCELRHIPEHVNTSLVHHPTSSLNRPYHSIRTIIDCKTLQVIYVKSSLTQDICQCLVSGSPPNLMLSIYLDGFRLNGGKWRVFVSNEAGSDHADLFIARETETTSNKGLENNALATSYVSGTVTGLAVILLTIVCLAIIKRRLKRRNCDCFTREQRENHEEREDLTKDSANTQQSRIGDRLPIRSDLGRNTCTSQIFQPPSCSDASGADPNFRFMWCQGADVTQVVFYLKGQPLNPETIQTGRTEQSNTAEILTSPVSQYSPLDVSSKTIPTEKREYSTMPQNRREYYITPCSPHTDTSAFPQDGFQSKFNEYQVHAPTISAGNIQPEGNSSYASVSDSDYENNDHTGYITIE